MKSFIAMLKSPDYKLQDVGVVAYEEETMGESEYYFINFLGTGYDSYLLTQMGSGQGKRYRYYYYYYVLRCLASYVAPKFTVEFDGSSITRSSLMLMACIGRYGGAGMKFAPSAEADDGLFNIVNIGDMPLSKRASSLAYLFNGKVNQHPRVQAWESNKIKIHADSDIAFQCDGEVIGNLPIEVELLPKTLRVIVPKKP